MDISDLAAANSISHIIGDFSFAFMCSAVGVAATLASIYLAQQLWFERKWIR
jgi:hypothetical protein